MAVSETNWSSQRPLVSLNNILPRMRLKNHNLLFFQIIDGKPEYKGMIDVIIKTARNEGVLALWKGWTPYFARSAPITVVTLMLMDAFMFQYKNRNQS